MNQWEQQLAQERAMRETAEYDAIVNAVAAAQSEADNAQSQYAYAMSIGDHASAAEHQRRIARAEARLVTLESGRDTVDEQRHTTGRVYPVQQQARSPKEIVDEMPLYAGERQLMYENLHRVGDPRFMQEVQGTYHAAMRMGLQRDTKEYLDFFRDRVGMGGAAGLNKDQLEIAKISGISPETYAENHRKVQALKARGLLQT